LIFLSQKHVLLIPKEYDMEQFSTRQNKISRLIQKEMAEMFLKELKSDFQGLLISVTVVRITSDLSLARCYLSIYPPQKSEETIHQIHHSSRSIRGMLGKRVAKQLRIIPELEFFVDDSLNYLENIDRLLKE
jgi:ribosome-binding factor A